MPDLDHHEHVEFVVDEVTNPFPPAVAARLKEFDREIQAIVNRKLTYAEGALAVLGVNTDGTSVRLTEDSSGYIVEAKAD